MSNVLYLDETDFTKIRAAKVIIHEINYHLARCLELLHHLEDKAEKESKYNRGPCL